MSMSLHAHLFCHAEHNGACFKVLTKQYAISNNSPMP